jgi:hypothetical protein
VLSLTVYKTKTLHSKGFSQHMLERANRATLNVPRAFPTSVSPKYVHYVLELILRYNHRRNISPQSTHKSAEDLTPVRVSLESFFSSLPNLSTHSLLHGAAHALDIGPHQTPTPTHINPHLHDQSPHQYSTMVPRAANGPALPPRLASTRAHLTAPI